ncbi:transposase [Gluconobacter japonicus]|nr:transposase [Gluconobacter japonicus]
MAASVAKSSPSPPHGTQSEADHGKLKQMIKPVRGFKTLKTAYAIINGFEVMRALKKTGKIFPVSGRYHGEVRLIERQFGVYAF